MFAAETSVNNNNLEETWQYLLFFFIHFFGIVVRGAVSRIIAIKSIVKRDVQQILTV